MKVSFSSARCWTVGLAASLLLGGVGQAQVIRSMINPSFEVPIIPNGCQAYVYASDTNPAYNRVPGWKTTDIIITDSNRANYHYPNTAACQVGNPALPAGGTRVIEFYSNGITDSQARDSNNQPLVLSADDGRQFVELNAEGPSRLYQEICLAPNEQVGFKFSHLGRMSSTVPDVAAFYVGGGGALSAGQRIVSVGDTSLGTGNIIGGGLSTDTSMSRGSLSSTSSNGTGYWSRYTGSFIVPSTLGGKQFISFEAVSSAAGGFNPLGTGNFLDNIQLTLKPFIEFTSATATEDESGKGSLLPKVKVLGTVPAGGMTIKVNINPATTTALTPLDYYYSGPIAGTAYIKVPAGVYDGTTSASFFQIPLTIVNDNIAEPTKQIVFDLVPDTNEYNIASTVNCGDNPNGTSTYTIIDKDLPPDLTVAKSGPAFIKPKQPTNADPAQGPVILDSPISYTLTVNTLNGDAAGVTTVTDTLPAGLSMANGAFTSDIWNCTATNNVITCVTPATNVLKVGTPSVITINNVNAASYTTAASISSFTNVAKVSNPNELPADQANNTGTFTTRLILSTLKKEVRLLPNGTFGTAVSGQPTQNLEYCLIATNYGGADLANYVIKDTLDNNTRPVFNVPVASDPAYGGLAVKYTRNPGAISGSLPPSVFTGNVLNVPLGTLKAGENARVCFQATIN